MAPYVAFSEGLKSVNTRRDATYSAMTSTYQGIQDFRLLSAVICGNHRAVSCIGPYIDTFSVF